MFCSKCGQQCADGVKFCTNCGAELVQAKPVKNEEGEVAVKVTEAVATTQDVKAEEPKKEKVKKEKKPVNTDFMKSLLMKKPVWIGAAAVVLLIVVCCFFLGGDEKTNYLEYTGKSIIEIEDLEEDDVYSAVLFDGTIVKIDDERVDNETYSVDRRTVCYDNEMDELVIIKDGKVTKTGIEDVYGVMVSDRGDSILYYSDTEYISYSDDYGYSSNIHVGTLNLYMIKDKKNYEIAEEVVTDSAVLSPNGQTVAYVTEYEGEEDFRSYYCVKGKKPVEIGKAKQPFALADKGAYVYYMDGDRVYVQKSKGDSEKLAGDFYSIEICFNKDRTEALYCNDGKTYISVKGGAKKKISTSEFSKVLCKDSLALEEDTHYGDDCKVYMMRTGFDTFEGKLLYNSYNSTITYLGKNFASEKVASGLSHYACASNNKSLVYTDGGDIWKVTDFANGGKPTKILNSGEAWAVYGAGNLEHVYYLTYDDELYYLNGKKGKKLADDVEEIYVSSNGKYCYYVVDNEEVYCSTEGGKGKKIVAADEAYFDTYGDRVYVFTEEDDVYTMYLMNGSKKKEVLSREESYSEYDEYWDY